MLKLSLVLLILFGTLFSQETLIKNGTVHTVSNGVLLNTDLIIKNNKIIAIGNNLATSGETIDATGKHVYPGLIAAYTNLGLVEVDAVRATKDRSEVGAYTPEVMSHIAFNPVSKISATVLINGVTTAVVAPTGGWVSGRSSILNMSGWNKEDMMVSSNNGLHINWPRMHTINAWWMKKSAKDQLKDVSKNIKSIYTFFEDAKTYNDQRNLIKSTKIDNRLEAMRDIFSKKLTVYVHADEQKQIEAIAKFKQDLNLKIVLVGGLDSWKCTDVLKSAKIPVILGQTHKLPNHQDSDYDINFKLPSLLEKAGVEFAISGAHTWTGVDWGARNLAFQAGQAVAFGLDKETALAKITLDAAKILGIEKTHGSIEVGKVANLVISNGDILDPLTQKVVNVFINGKNVDLNNHQTDLYKKYSNR